MPNTNTDLISCIKSALYGQAVTCDISKVIGPAYAHGVLNLLYYATMTMSDEFRPDEKLLAFLRKQAYAGVMREAIQQKMLAEIFRRFETSQIRCVALKGAVMKELYPKPELRYMSDMDILIDASKAFEARKHLVALGCKVMTFDISSDTDHYLTPEGINIEIKKTLVNESFNAQTRKFTENLLNFARAIDAHKYVCRLPNEEHYAYMLCHIIKHLTDGGVGVRPIMDIWICMKQMPFDRVRLNKLLQELELTKFAQTVEHLASVWFGDSEAEELDDELGAHILGSGAFGTEEQRVTDRLLTKKTGSNKVVYVIRRVFPRYGVMRKHYPILRKIPILLPFFWLWRIIYAGIFRRKKLLNEIEAVTETDSDKLRSREEFFKRCGINL